MELLSAEAARPAVQRLVEAPGLVALAVDERARQGGNLRVLAIGSADEAVLVRPPLAPIADLLRRDRPYGAWDAKPVHRLLLREIGAGPARWACVKLSELLLLGGRDGELTLDAAASRRGHAPPPHPEAGLAELATHTGALARLLAAQGGALKADGLGAASKLEAAAVSPLAEMEHHGMPFDAAAWRRLHDALRAEQRQLAGELHRLFAKAAGADLFGGSTLDLDNDAQLKRALSALGHAVPDARRATLAELPAPLGPTLSRYRELTKLVSAYGEGFLEHLGEDGRLHPTFEQIGASTGRISCHAPNMQSIVKGAPHRACFRAPAGRTLVVGDYATCELRILAEMSGDPVFAEAFARGDDLHARVASRVFGKPVSKSEHPELRERAKAVSFGLVYGMGAQGLARTIDAPLAQAEELLTRYFQSFPKIKGFLEHTAKEALERGFARTLAGRRLYLSPGEDRSSRSAAERVAKNMPIQGTSADITKLALGRLHAALADIPEAHLVNTVHDEIVVECRQADAGAVEAVMQREMQAAGAELLRKVPVAVDVAVTATWQK